MSAVLMVAQVLSAVTLDPPVNVKVSLTEDSRWELSWQPADATTQYYKLYRALTSTVVVTDNFVNTHAAYFKVTDVAAPEAGLPYYFKVQAVGVTTGAVSDLTKCPVKSTRPLAPDSGSITLTAQNSKILIKWDPAAETGVTVYNIYRSAGAEFGALASVASNQGQYIDTGVANGVRYSYKMSSMYNGEGPLSAPKSMTPFASPFAPKNLSGTVSGSNIVLNWSDFGIRGTYDLAYFDIYSNTASSTADYNNVTSLSYTLSGYAPGSRHYFKVTAEDVNGNSSMPAYTSVYLPDGSINTPSALAITSYTSGRVSFTWASQNESSQISGFRVYRNDVTLTTTALTSYTDTSVINGQVYWYSVTAYKNSEPEVTGCNSVTVTVAPAAPVNLTVSQTGTGALQLWWNNPANETASIYNVYRSYTVGDFSALPALTQTSKTFTDSGLATGTARYFRLSSVRDGFESAFSEISAMSITVPASPQDITGIGGTPGNGYVYLSWTALADYDLRTFTVYYKTDAASGYTSVTTSAEDRYINSLSNGTGYTFKVTGTNKLGSGSVTTAAAYRMTPLASVSLGKPLNFSVDTPGNSTLALSWDSVNGAVRYHIYRSLDPVNTADTFAGTATVNSYVDQRAFTENAVFWYKVIAIDTGNNSGYAFSDIKGNSAFTRAGAPDNVELNNTAGGIMLSWAVPKGEYTFDANPLKYRIYRSTVSGVFNAPPAETQLTYYEDKYFGDMGANTLVAALYYRIRSVDSANYEDSGAQDYSVEPRQPIDPPAVLLARPGDKKVTLTWKKVTPDYYNIYRSTDTINFTYPVAYNVDFNSKEYTDEAGNSPPVNKIQYHYKIAAVTKGGEGPKSNIASAMPYAPPKISTTPVSCVKGPGKTVTLGWVKADPADLNEGYDISRYNIYRSRDNGWTYDYLSSVDYLGAGGGTNFNTTYADTATAWDNKYTYVVKVEDFNGNTDAVYHPGTIELPLPKNKVRLHANLTDLSKGQSLTWQYVLIKGGKIKVNIYTLSGVFVKNILDTEYTLPVSALSPYESPQLTWDGTNAKGNKVASGVYLFMLEQDGERTVEKIAVIK